MSKQSKSFTLIEILISISLFSIIIIFLYQSLDMTQKSNDFYSDKLDKKQQQNSIKQLLFLDIINLDKNSTVKITQDREKNSIVQFKTSNIYHNPFYENITYLVTREQNLFRIESKEIFKKDMLNDNFFDNSSIDILETNIDKFKVKIQKDKKIVFYILKQNGEKIIFSY